MKPDTKQIVKPMLIQIIPRGDGSFVLKPTPVAEDFEQWIGTIMAASILGIDQNSIYPLLDPNEPYLIYRRPLKGVYLILLESVVKYKELSSEPHFWTDENTKERLRYSRTIYQAMRRRAGIKDETTTSHPALTLR